MEVKSEEEIIDSARAAGSLLPDVFGCSAKEMASEEIPLSERSIEEQIQMAEATYLKNTIISRPLEPCIKMI